MKWSPLVSRENAVDPLPVTFGLIVITSYAGGAAWALAVAGVLVLCE